MTFLVRSTETTQFSYCNLSLLHRPPHLVTLQRFYFWPYHLSLSNIFSLSLVFHFIISSTRWTEIFVCLLIGTNFQDRVRHTVGKQKASAECCIVPSAWMGQKHPKPTLSQSPDMNLTLSPDGQAQSETWFAEGSRNYYWNLAHPGCGTHVHRSCHPGWCKKKFLVSAPSETKNTVLCVCVSKKTGNSSSGGTVGVLIFPAFCNIKQNAESRLGSGLGIKG